MTQPDLHDLTKRYRDAWQRRDPAELAACHHPDGVIVSPMFATVQGSAAIQASYAALFTAFPDWDFTVDTIVTDPPYVANFSTVRATHTHDLFGYPGTHKRIEIQAAVLMTVENGLITHERRIYDFTGLLVQIGVLKAKPA